MSRSVQHHRAERRFEIIEDHHACVLDYRLDAGVMTITHTVVPDEVGGRGIAAELVAAAFETARREGWKVRPACSYAAAWAERHPAQADLLA
jgi:predicted GNAT family acetyltransferase